jgi:hypothetical protein
MGSPFCKADIHSGSLEIHRFILKRRVRCLVQKSTPYRYPEPEKSMNTLRVYSVRSILILSSNLRLTKLKLRGFSPQANYTDRASAACRLS